MKHRIRVLAAGSLRSVWPAIQARFNADDIDIQFGPAGTLQRRITRGEECDLFLSANLAHPQTLVRAGLALNMSPFCRNALALTVRQDLCGMNWLELLQNPAYRVATSTPLSDPCGDYAWQLFERIESDIPEAGDSLKQRALTLVGGEQSAAVPAGIPASSWVIHSNQAEVFIGYSSYARQRASDDGVGHITIPERFQPDIQYSLALCHPRALPLAEFLLSPMGNALFQRYGFLPLDIRAA